MGSNVLTGPVMMVPAIDGTTRHSTAQVTVGTQAWSEDGDWVYVTAGGAITTSGDPVSVAGALSAVVRGDLDVGQFLGIAEAPFASGESGYVRRHGPTSVVVESGAVAGGGLQLSSTVGKLKAITTSGTQIAIALEASDNASAAAISVFLT